MTLSELINTMEGIASNQPDIKMIVENDVFRLNSVSDAKYGVFAFVQGQHTGALDSSVINYSFNLFYVDRLLNDKSNQIEVQSVGITTLHNIILALEDAGVYSDQPYTFQVFNQRFLDECAGVYCNVTFSVPVNYTCPETIANLDNDVIII